MKKFILPLVLVASIVGVTTVSSCKKTDTKTAKDYIVGTWKETFTANDLNNNKTLDASEQVADTSNDKYTFTAGGTGTVSTVFADTAIAVPIAWSLSTDNQYVVVSIPLAQETISLHIDAINATSMTLRDTTGGVYSWGIFAKQ